MRFEESLVKGLCEDIRGLLRAWYILYFRLSIFDKVLGKLIANVNVVYSSNRVSSLSDR